ncbi:hypothetical protein BAC2_00123 [uncultured bacterium]|nr:hypothetical protein BAC2_00123 [uncultured bacterium]
MRPIAVQTIQELEGVDYGEPTYDSFVVTNTHRLRRVPIKQFTLDDLRFMVLQKQGLPWLVPRALAHLEQHPLAEGTFYRGDLLNAVMEIPDDWWAQHPDLRARMGPVLQAALARIHKIKFAEDLEAKIRAATPRFA